MGEVIDFVKRKKNNKKRELSLNSPIFRKFLVRAVKLLANFIKSGIFSVVYIVKEVAKRLIKVVAILTIFVFLVEYIVGDIGYKSIYNALLLLSMLTIVNILASVYLKRKLRTKQ